MLLIRDVTRADFSVVEELLVSNSLGSGGIYDPGGIDVIVAEVGGAVVGTAEFQLACDIGRDEGRPAHPGEQAWPLTMAVTFAHLGHGVGRALLAEVARRARDTGCTFLALVPLDGAGAANREAFFHAVGTHVADVGNRPRRPARQFGAGRGRQRSDGGGSADVYALAEFEDLLGTRGHKANCAAAAVRAVEDDGRLVRLVVGDCP